MKNDVITATEVRYCLHSGWCFVEDSERKMLPWRRGASASVNAVC